MDGKSTQIKLILDEPWVLDPSEKTVKILRSNIFSADVEGPSSHKNRIKDGWRRNGGILIPTADGTERWWFREEIEWADKANALSASDEGEQTVSSVPTTDTIPETTVVQPGFLSLWGMHIGVAAVALVLSGLVIWRGFIASDWSPLSS